MKIQNNNNHDVFRLPDTDSLKELLESEIHNLELLMDHLERARKKNAVKGRLRIAQTPHGTRYYHVTRKDKPSGRYLRKNQAPFIRRLAQSDYERKLHRVVGSWYAILRRCRKLLSETSFTQMKTDTSSRRLLLEPVFLSDEEYVAAWRAREYETNQFHEEEKIHLTKSGIKVRSKSEKIIADILFDKGIPFRYEQRLEISGHVVYPDFILLDLPSRREIILEHLGMMDDPQYVSRAIKKGRIYLQAGFVPGKNLLYTVETREMPFDVEVLETLLSYLFPRRTCSAPSTS